MCLSYFKKKEGDGMIDDISLYEKDEDMTLEDYIIIKEQLLCDNFSNKCLK
jgi:hypothetical protein